MKKLILLSLAVLFLLNLNAQTSDKKWGVGLGVGPYGGLNNSSIGFMPEVYFSRYLSPKLDLMLKNEWGLFNSDIKSKLDVVNPFLNLRYKLTDENKNFRPYLYAGPGLLWDNQTSGPNFDLGVGSKLYVSPSTAFYLEAGYINGIKATVANKSVRDNFWKATIGIEFDLGKKKDSDGDGVSDAKDKCPNTPPGVKVDEKGCPVDTDGDGVPDYKDDCPTVPGLASLNGCPDKDGDGVADKDDRCPDVPGLVSLKGCPDTDGDGVADIDDKCPDTPKGWKVDASGCPVDTDGDGVPDAIDKCPTVAGPKENNGCPVEKTAEEIEAEKMKVDPVYFDFNKSVVKADQMAKIDKVVSLLKDNKNYKVDISGYCDSKGTEAYNLGLSKRRAAAVVKAIMKKGIKKAQIASEKGFGKANPVASNDTEEGRALNRRAEFKVFKAK